MNILSKPLIALIDDSPLVLTALSRKLEQNGFDVKIYFSIQAFYEAQVLPEIDIVIIDYWLENECGLDLVHYLNNLERKGLIRQVILSGSDLSDIELPDSIDLVIRKPWGDESFIKDLKSLLLKEKT